MTSFPKKFDRSNPSLEKGRKSFIEDRTQNINKLQEKFVNVNEKLKPLYNKSTNWTDGLISLMLKKQGADDGTPVSAAKGPIVFGLWAFLIVFVFFGLWSMFAPISSAAVAKGQVVVFSSKKTIQHLEGGIISEILVKEGDVVQEGQPLIKLNETSSKARQEILLGQYRVLKATELRLIAERDNKPNIVFDDKQLNSDGNTEISKITDGQLQIFESRKKYLEGQANVYNEKIAQLNKEIQGFGAEKTSSSSQLGLIREEIETVEQLVRRGQGLKPRLLALKRQQADLVGNVGKLEAAIARAKQTINETQLEIMNIKNDFQNKVNTELKDTQAQLADIQERLRAADDVMERTVITSPQAGKITGLKFHTIGGVIAPGATILDIVPQDDKFVLDAQVSVQDIDVVHAGMEARVRLSAFKAAITPTIPGKVVNVSGDRFIDETTKMPYYLARVELDQKELEKFRSGLELYPGMQADVLFITGNRSFLSYLLGPLNDDIFKGLRED